MIEIVLLSIFVVIPVLILLFTKSRDSEGPRRPDKQTMLYAPGSSDIAGEAYHPARKDGAMPFPLGKKKERKKTETFRKHEKD